MLGGKPLRAKGSWPGWPEADENTEAALGRVVRSARWTVSCPGQGQVSAERLFAREFASYLGVPHCVSVDHGSAALVVALEALDIGPGDEVVVPVQTWVATATAVLRVGALPVLADVDPRSGCLTPASVSAVLSDQTRAIIVVHLACTVADLDGLTALAAEAGIELIEDCAQAHGARWRGRAVGSWGTVGAFSFQGGKVLTGGEGGAVTTSDSDICRRAQQLRADSRVYRDGIPVAGEMEIIEAGEIMGTNYCMSEFHAALLSEQLSRLDDQHARRERQVGLLEKQLSALGWASTIPVPEQVSRRSIYEFGIGYEPSAFGDKPAARVAEAISAELGFTVFAPDDPLDRNLLFRPHTNRRFARAWTQRARARSLGRPFPGAESYGRTTLLFHHSALLGPPSDADDIVAALSKVSDAHGEL